MDRPQSQTMRNGRSLQPEDEHGFVLSSWKKIKSLYFLDCLKKKPKFLKKLAQVDEEGNKTFITVTDNLKTGPNAWKFVDKNEHTDHKRLQTVVRDIADQLDKEEI